MECRLLLWWDGDITELVTEGRTIEQYLPLCPNLHPNTQLTRLFSNPMFEGKTKAALKLITGHKHGGLLKLDDPLTQAV